MPSEPCRPQTINHAFRELPIPFMHARANTRDAIRRALFLVPILKHRGDETLRLLDSERIGHSIALANAYTPQHRRRIVRPRMIAKTNSNATSSTLIALLYVSGPDVRIGDADELGVCDMQQVSMATVVVVRCCDSKQSSQSWRVASKSPLPAEVRPVTLPESSRWNAIQTLKVGK